MEFIIILTMLALSAYFSGMEIAFISSSRMSIEMARKKENLASRWMIYLADRPKEFITTMLVGNNIALVIYGIYMGDLLTRLLAPSLQLASQWQLLVQTVISTLVILVTAEFLPKAIFSLNATKTFRNLTIPTFVIFQLFRPISWVITRISDFFLWVLGNPADSQEELFLKEELKFFLSEQIEDSDHENLDSEIQIFQNALDFSDLKIRDCMIPRREIVGVELFSETDNLKQKFIETGLSKIVVFKNTIDNAIGYVHSFDLFKMPETVRSILLPIEFVHETESAKEVMDKLIKKRRSMAIVLDEYGGTSGLVTIEDILEELFGDIEDEHDISSLTEQKISENEFLFSARLEIDYLNETYQLDLPESDDYDTLGGFLVTQLEDIPEQGQRVELEDFIFVPEKVSVSRVEEIRMIRIGE